MDKLQPIIKHHFWILLVPVLAMNLWGYFSANAALKAATSDREKKLDSVKSGISAGTTDPNEKYAKELSQRNEILEKYVDEELLDLWNRQKKRMVWPASVASRIPKLYRGDITDRRVRFDYQKDYPGMIRKLHESVEPFVLDKRGITWTPKVDFPIQLIPQIVISEMAVESGQMWDTQEDIWMTQFILEAIRQMNKDADSETSSVIRRVISYRLLGGDGTPVLSDAGTAGGGESDGAAMVEMSGRMGAPIGGGGQAAGGAQGSRITSSVKFDPAEEFGPGGEPDPTANAAGGADPAMGSIGAMSSRAMDGPAEGDSSEEGGEPTGPLRFVGTQSDDIPYVERGFYLSVIINQNKVVDFLVALSNSEWPVRIVRFQLGRNPFAPDPFVAHSAGSPGGGVTGMRASARGFNSSMRPGAGMNAGGGGAEGMLNSVMASRGGPMRGGIGTQGAGTFSTGFPEDSLQHPDLIQLDLAGVITMFKQPESDKPKEATEEGKDGATGEEAPSSESNAEGAATAESGEMPAEGETAPADGAGEATSGTTDAASTDPAATTSDPTGSGDSEMPAEATPAEPTSGTAEPAPGTAEPVPGTAEPTSGTAEPTSGTAEPTSGTAEPTSDATDPESGETMPAPSDDFPEPANPTASEASLPEGNAPAAEGEGAQPSANEAPSGEKPEAPE